MQNLFQVNCFFAEIKVQRSLIKENFKGQKDLVGGHIVFFSFWGERSCASSSNAKSQMVCYPEFKTMEIMINNVVLMFSPSNEKTPSFYE